MPSTPDRVGNERISRRSTIDASLRNGAEAVRENLEFQPEVVTLDINMPEMDGLTALSLIMAERPVAVRAAS